MKIFSLFLLILLGQCTTTIAPGYLWNSTTEHIQSPSTNISLGSGRIIYKAEACSYGSIFLHFFYSGTINNPHKIARESGIKSIGVVDYSSFNLIGPLFYKTCTIVWGDKE